MKTRAQIYSQEAAGILRDISMYRVLREGQLLRLYPGKEAVVRNLLSYLRKQGRVLFEDGLYFMPPGRPENIDWGLLAAVWVLVDFIDRVEFHAAGEFPVKIIFSADGVIYEIVHAEQGQEALLTSIMGMERKESPHFIVLVDDTKQIAELDLPNVNGFCTVTEDGDIQYYQKE